MSVAFDQLARRPAEHFQLYMYGAVSHVIDQLGRAFGSVDDAIASFPFLDGYRTELANHGVRLAADTCHSEWWSTTLGDWEAGAACRLPIRNLRRAIDCDHAAVMLLLAVGLLEEDARFGLLFDSVHGNVGQHRPTLGLLAAWWREALHGTAREMLLRWQRFGLLEVPNLDSPRLEWSLQIPIAIWDALVGGAHEQPAPGLRFRPPGDLLSLDQLILSSATRATIARLPGLLESGVAEAVIVRGPRRNGRRTLLGSLARATGRGTLEVDWPLTDDRWCCIGPLATLLNAMPLVELDLAPGESQSVRPLSAYAGPLGIALGRQGGVSGPGIRHAVALELPIPDPEQRRQHWLAGLDGFDIVGIDTVSHGPRFTGGNIRRAAELGRVQAQLDGRAVVTAADVQHASRVLNREALDTLAMRLNPTGDWSHLAVGDHTWRELRNLESRCRQRERLSDAVGETVTAQLNAGVRALFMGSSGTGKSLAARLLAAALGRDLYRLDLSAVVNKYIGETEKNLERIFSRAEELDIILLLDEGDALLSARTSVQSSNDRYANLETNYLLQRLESFEGIVIVTTNASEHIDAAFLRRMDVVITFPPPGPMERWTIWQMLLPVRHAVDGELLEEITRRCELRGGQIRNAVVHASLLALDDGGTMTSFHLVGAVQREYRRMNAVCPLRAVGAGD